MSGALSSGALLSSAELTDKCAFSMIVTECKDCEDTMGEAKEPILAGKLR